MSTRSRGMRGERVAAAYLARNGYRICSQNFRTRLGEVDIVCEKTQVLVFVEVKSWSRIPEEELTRSIDRRKRRKIGEVAHAFLQRFPEYANHLIRFDVISVQPEDETIRHYEGAFESEWRG